MTEVNVKGGPVVAEIPRGALGPVDDAFFRFVTDIGNTGPDKGKGGKYLFAHRDYRGKIPAKDFWSFMVYDSQHRSMLETNQKLAGLDSLNPSVKPNADESYTMWFGPKAPKGHEGNWIQTMPGKSYNVLLRLYGPLQPFFDKTWKPGDFEPVK